MKYLKKISILSLALLAMSCGSDDDGSETTTAEPLIGNYYPSTIDDLWFYNVENTNPDDATNNSTTTDLIQVVSGTSSSYSLEANNGNSPANGRMNAFLVSGTLNRSNDKLLYSGILELPEEVAELSSQTISLSNVVLYDLNAVNGELFTTSGTFSENIDIDTSVVPLNMNYTFTSTKLDNLSTLTVDGTSYNDIVKTKLNLEVTITASIEILSSTQIINVLETQDILSIDCYFAKDIGLIKADAIQGYTLSTEFTGLELLIPDFEIPFPDTATVNNNQELDNFNVAPE